MLEINKELLKRIDEGLKERQTGVDIDVSALEQIKALFHISTNKGLRMNGEQRLMIARMYFDLQKNNMEAIMADGREGYQSLLYDINKQIEMARNELRQIEEELKQVDKTVMREFNGNL